MQHYRDPFKYFEFRGIPCTLFQIKRLKSLQESSNKLKQEKWVDEKTRRIKEQTVRGLEPEIQRLMARHTAELANLESERERQLAAQVQHTFRGITNFLPKYIYGKRRGA